MEGWPVRGAWKEELDSVADKYDIAPLVAYVVTAVDGEPTPIPPSKYESLIPGSIVHLRISFVNYVFGETKSVLVAKAEEVNVLYKAPVVPDSPTKKRFMDIAHRSEPGSPSKKNKAVP